MKVRKISDLVPSRVQAALTAIREGDDKSPGVSLQSIKHYTRVVKAFSRWLWRDGRAKEDSIAHLRCPDPAPDRRHKRRALLADELARLVRAAATGPVVLKTTGADRAALYLVASGTGFRANECRSLVPESFDLVSDPPTITVSAGYSKRRRDDRQPIRPELAAALRPWLASKAPGEPVFGELTKHTNLLIQPDLKAAGIDYERPEGFADFHALRHSFISALAMSSAPVKVVQSLARHSTPVLTLNTYSHVQLLDQTSALAALPDPTRPAPTREALAATGTHGRTHRKTFAPHLIHSTDVGGRTETVGGDRRLALAGGSARESSSAETLENTGLDVLSRLETVEDGSGGGGIRTHGRLSPTTVFKTVPIGRSGTPPNETANREQQIPDREDQ